MLDISGQTAAALPGVTQPVTAAKPVTAIPSVSGSMSRLVEVTALAVVLVVALTGSYLSFTRAQLTSQVATKARAVEELTQALALPDRVSTATAADQLTQGIEALSGPLALPPTWTPLLAELARRTPAAVTVTTISVDDQQTVRVSGSAPSFLDVAQLLSSVQASAELTDVTLESSAVAETTSGSSSVTFAIRTTFKPATIEATAAKGEAQPGKEAP